MSTYQPLSSDHDETFIPLGSNAIADRLSPGFLFVLIISKAGPSDFDRGGVTMALSY